MKAISFENGAMRVIEKDVPRPGPGEALIKTRCAGICNTDIELFKGYMGFSGTPGHEAAGVVEQAPGAPEWEGARVCCDINWGVEPWTSRHGGDARHCPGRKVLGILNWDGTFTDYFLAPLSNLHRIPDNVSDDEAVFAEPLAAALEISQQLHLTADMKVLVLGDGKLGLLCACALRRYCPKLVLAGKHEEKLAIAAAQKVATRHIPDPAALPGKLLGAFGPFDLVVEATGAPEGIAYALDLVRPEGTIVAKTTSHAPSSINLAKLVVDEITVTGSRCGNTGLALSFLGDRMLDPRPLIETRYPFARFEEAFARASRKGALKVLVDF